VTPGRGQRGRSYSEADVARLQLLKAVVDRGHAIGSVASLDETSLRHLLDTSASADPVRRASHVELDDVSRAAVSYDRETVTERLATLAAMLPPRRFVFDVAVPLLADVGREWAAGRLRASHEHMLSAVVRDTLASLVRLMQPPQAPTSLVFATPSGERHELGILCAALLAASHGVGALYLGADLPADDILDAVERCRPQAVVLGLTQPNLGTNLTDLATRLPRGTGLWLGGPSADVRAAARAVPGAVPVESLERFDQLLVQVASAATAGSADVKARRRRAPVVKPS
jgi:methanogenic corrinoid protein MtbC1